MESHSFHLLNQIYITGRSIFNWTFGFFLPLNIHISKKLQLDVLVNRVTSFHIRMQLDSTNWSYINWDTIIASAIAYFLWFSLSFAIFPLLLALSLELVWLC